MISASAWVRLKTCVCPALSSVSLSAKEVEFLMGALVLNTPDYVTAPLPANESERLNAVQCLGLLDTPAEERFDAIVGLVAKIFNVPISYVALIDHNRQWFKAKVGIEARETSRDVAFCSHAILQDQPLIITDTHADERFAHNPLVIGEPFIHFYAGAPLRDATGQKVGTLCLADRTPREFRAEDVDLLLRFGGLIEREFALNEVVDLQTEKLQLKDELIVSLKDRERLQVELLRKKEEAERCLLSLMPAEIADELCREGSVQPRFFQDVTVLFTDFVDFTTSTESLAAEELISLLNGYFVAFDQVVASFGLEKLKTIGDSYMCAAGLPAENRSHAADAVLAAIAIRNVVREFASVAERTRLAVRIGIHTGPVVAGVIGLHRYGYDIWGDTVNYASRMESCGAQDCINISDRTYARVKDFFVCEPRGKVSTKEHRELDMYFVKDVQPALLGETENGVPKPFQRRYRSYFKKDLESFPALQMDLD
jgi:adenylate cyclase